MVGKPKPCKFCGGTNHFAFQCRLRPRKPPKPRVYKPMKRTAIKPKVDEEWERTKKLWFELNPPDHAGYYYCKIRPCLVPGSPMLKNETRLDHIKPKGKFPLLKYVLTNLRPAHDLCNGVKGSLSDEQYRTKVLDMKQRER